MSDTVATYTKMAAEAGMPMSQVAHFKDYNYLVLPWALRFHALAREADRDRSLLFWILCGGARGPGKSHAALAQAGLDDCYRIPGMRWIYLRQYKYKAGESMGTLARKIFSTDPTVKISSDKIVFPNTGSEILIGGYNHPGDIDKYLGIQYDGGIFEEATQLPEETYKKIRGSIRSTIPGWIPRAYLSTNPGGVGHAHVKQEFITPFRNGIEDHMYLGGKTAFVPGRYKDNPFLDDGYIRYLEALPGQLGRAWRLGDWDSYEGMAFPHWNHEIHVVQPFDYPDWWPKWRAVDWGFHSPFCCHWYVKDPDIGRIYVVDEVYEKGLTDKQQVELIRSRKGPEWNGVVTYADPNSYWERKSDKAGDLYTSADIYHENGVTLTKADNNRTQGYRRFNQLLANLPDGLPGIQYFDTYCVQAIKTIADLPADPNNKEDVDTDAEDHAYDTDRYGTTNHQTQKVKKPKRSDPSIVEQYAKMGRL